MYKVQYYSLKNIAQKVSSTDGGLRSLSASCFLIESNGKPNNVSYCSALYIYIFKHYRNQYVNAVCQQNTYCAVTSMCFKGSQSQDYNSRPAAPPSTQLMSSTSPAGVQKLPTLLSFTFLFNRNTRSSTQRNTRILHHEDPEQSG